MSKEKQIEIIELTKTLCLKPCDTCSRYGQKQKCVHEYTAERLYNAGYRKQSEWISVDERLPTVEENENGLVGIVNGYNGKIRFTDAIIFVDYCFEEKEWWSQDYDLTDCKVEYWMPLPEAPKGGAG